MIKKLFAFFLSFVLVCSLAVPVLAVDITISGTATGYDAYRIFDVVVSDELNPEYVKGCCDNDACDSRWCRSSCCDSDCCNSGVCRKWYAKYQDPESRFSYVYTVNDKYAVAVREAFHVLKPDSGDLGDNALISEISQFDEKSIRTFADVLYPAIVSLQPESSSEDGKFVDLEQGYYLVAEKFETDMGDSVSLVVLDTAGRYDVNMVTKENVPTLAKHVSSAISSAEPPKYYDCESQNWVSGCVVSFGDIVLYDIFVEAARVNGNFDTPGYYALYDTYRYVVHDTVSDGLRIMPETIKCWVGDGHEVTPDKILIRQRGDTMLDDGCSLEIVFDDFKGLVSEHFNFDNIYSELPSSRMDGSRGDDLRIMYKCEILDTARRGDTGNPNVAHLEFSNNPYDEASTAETPDDKCSVFTFDLRVDKVDKSGKPLTGAEFSLYKQEQSYEYGVIYDDAGNYDGYGWHYVYGDWLGPVVINPVDGSDGTRFVITGLGDGRYRLVENKAPIGYQKCDDIEFEIVVEGELEYYSDDPKLTELDVVDMAGNSMTQGGDAMFSVDLNSGMITTKIVNESGAKLPSTGGAGVYGLYMVGAAVIVMGAVMVGAVTGKKKEDV